MLFLQIRLPDGIPGGLCGIPGGWGGGGSSELWLAHETPETRRSTGHPCWLET